MAFPKKRPPRAYQRAWDVRLVWVEGSSVAGGGSGARKAAFQISGPAIFVPGGLHWLTSAPVAAERHEVGRLIKQGVLGTESRARPGPLSHGGGC